MKRKRRGVRREVQVSFLPQRPWLVRLLIRFWLARGNPARANRVVVGWGRVGTSPWRAMRVSDLAGSKK